MTKRVILVFAVFLIATLLSVYILDINFFEKKAYVQDTREFKLSKRSQPADETAQKDAYSDNGDNQNIEVFMLPPKKTPIPVLDGKWQLVWRDTFGEAAINYEWWTKMERRDNYNRELQYYSVSNTYVKDGMLYLTATKEEKDSKQYVSGMIDTENKVNFMYGRIEARIKLPAGKGLFPAFWLMSENYEIDIMEMIGSEPDIVYAVNHCFKKGRLVKTHGYKEDVETSEFHIYALEWEEDELRWYIDDEMIYSTRENVSDEPMFILFTLAVGGVWPGAPNKDTPFPASMVIDEISVYKDITKEVDTG